MAISISGGVEFIFKFLQQNTLPTVSYTGNPKLDFMCSYAGTTLTQFYMQRYTVTTTPTLIDVTTGLFDAFGNAVSFALVRGILIINNDIAHSLTAGGGSNALFATLPVLVGLPASANSTGSAIATNTQITTSGTVKNIQLVASAGSILVDLAIVGT